MVVGRRTIVTTFLIVFLISVLLIVFAKFGALNGFASIFSRITFPIQKGFYSSFGRVFESNNSLKIKTLQEESLTLIKKNVDQRILEKDIQALRDQFAVSNPSSTKLLAAKILGFPSFIPGISIPETFIIDKGTDDGLKNGQAVIFKDNLIGKITKLTSNKSVVYLVTHPDFTFTAKILDSNTEGIVRGLGGGEMMLDNALLSDTIKPSETVLTKGDLTMENTGLPPDLVVGKIIAVNKNPSAIFQTAGIKSLVDFSKLETIFVYVGNN